MFLLIDSQGFSIRKEFNIFSNIYDIVTNYSFLFVIIFHIVFRACNNYP